jgi:hypothetical protein
MSVQHALSDRLDGFEEAARWLLLIGQGDVKLEVRLGAADRQAHNNQSGASSDFQQCLGLCERGSASVMDDDPIGVHLGHQPLWWHAAECFATGPAYGIERFELGSRGSTQYASDDERVAATAAATERPHPGHITRLKEDDQGRADERSPAFADHHLDRTRPEPAHGGALAEHRQAVLHPAHQQAAPTNIPDRAGGKPGNERDSGNSDEFGHGRRDDSTPAASGWMRVLREFMYGMTTYEFVQQAREMRASMERLFMVGVFGDMLGVPILPSYYGLRLLPWVVPEIEAWKREVLRERELGSSHEHHLHGL